MILLLLILSLPWQQTEAIEVDRVELNHVYNRHGEIAFSQWIFWRWSNWHDGHGWHVSQWMMKKGGYSQHREGNRHEIRIYHELREIVIHTPMFREVHTRHDPEVIDQEKLPIDQRKPYLSEVSQ